MAISIPTPGDAPWTAKGSEIITEINRMTLSYPTITYITSDLTNLTTTLADATGLSFAVAANTRYLFECFFTYNADSLRDVLCTWTIPAGLTGWWTPNGVVSSATSNGGTTGELNGQSVVLTNNHALSGGGTTDMFAGPVGSILTSATAGTVQFRYALFSTAAGAGGAIIRAGSMIKVTQLV